MPRLSISQKEQSVIQGFKDEVKRKFAGQRPHFLLFGSKARGDSTSASDIDLLIVLDRLTQKDKNFISDLATQLYLKY